jgi:broad specificity phosphatase PhoE
MQLLMRLWLVRHGMTTANKEGIIQGQQEWPLDVTGERQGVLTGSELGGQVWWRAYTSDLGRAVRTAELCLNGPPPAVITDGGASSDVSGGRETHLPFIRKDARLREFALGAREGRPSTVSLAQCEAEARAAGLKELPLLEKGLDVSRRMTAWLDEILSEAVAASSSAERGFVQASAAAGEAPSVLVVSHGGCLLLFLKDVLKLKLGGLSKIENCSITVVRVLKSANGRFIFQLERCNDVRHVASCTATSACHGSGGEDSAVASQNG